MLSDKKQIGILVIEKGIVGGGKGGKGGEKKEGKKSQQQTSET